MSSISLESVSGCAVALARQETALVPLMLDRALAQSRDTVERFLSKQASLLQLAAELRAARSDLAQTARLLAQPLVAQELGLSAEVSKRLREGTLVVQGQQLQEKFSLDAPGIVASAGAQLGRLLRRGIDAPQALVTVQQLLGVTQRPLSLEGLAGPQIREVLQRLGPGLLDPARAHAELASVAQALVLDSVGHVGETVAKARSAYADFQSLVARPATDLFSATGLGGLQSGAAVLRTALAFLGDSPLAADVQRAAGYVESAVQLSQSVMTLVSAASGAGSVMALIGMAGGLGGMGGLGSIAGMGGGQDAAAAQRHAEVMGAIRELTDIVKRGFATVNVRLDRIADQLEALTRQVENVAYAVDETLRTARNIEALTTQTLFAVERTQLQVFQAYYQAGEGQWEDAAGLLMSGLAVNDDAVMGGLRHCTELVKDADSQRILYPAGENDHERIANRFNPGVPREEALTALPSLLLLAQQFELEYLAGQDGAHVAPTPIHEPTVSDAVSRYAEMARLARPQFRQLAPARRNFGHAKTLRQGLERCRAVQAYLHSQATPGSEVNELLDRLLRLLEAYAMKVAGAYDEALVAYCEKYLQEFKVPPPETPPNPLDSLQTQAGITHIDPAYAGSHNLLKGEQRSLSDYVPDHARLFIGDGPDAVFPPGGHLTFKVKPGVVQRREAHYNIFFGDHAFDDTLLDVEVRLYGQQVGGFSQTFRLVFMNSKGGSQYQTAMGTDNVVTYLNCVNHNAGPAGDEAVRKALQACCATSEARNAMLAVQRARLLARPDRYQRPFGAQVAADIKNGHGSLVEATQNFRQLARTICGVLQAGYGGRFEQADALHASLLNAQSPATKGYLSNWAARASNGKLVNMEDEVTGWALGFSQKARELARAGAQDPMPFGFLHAQALLDSIAQELDEG